MYVLAPRALASMGVAAAACGFAFWRGRTPERIGAASYGAAWAITPAVQLYPLARLQWGVMAVDAAAAAAMVALALRSDRWWPLGAAALCLLVVVEHLGYAVAPPGLARAYFAGEEIWGYAVLLILVVGAAIEPPGATRLSGATSPA